jgi:two-component system sensor histidine kinase ChiS
MLENAYLMPYLEPVRIHDAGALLLFGAGALEALALFAAGTALYVLRKAGDPAPAAERRLRAVSFVSLFVIAFSLIFPMLPGGAFFVAAASALFFAGFLAFELCTIQIFLSQRALFRYAALAAVLPALAALAAPLAGFAAPVILGWFSCVMFVFCVVIFVFSRKEGRPLKGFVPGVLSCFFPALSLLLPPSASMLLCAASVFARLFLEYGHSTERRNADFPAEENTAPLSVELSAADVPAETLISVGESPGQDDTMHIAPFIPREFLSILNKESIEELKVGDHIEQEMTIFFSDIRQFTELSEKLTPEENFAFINSYLSRIVPEIIKNGGFVDKFIGDAILALVPQNEGADMAVRTAIAIQEKVQEYNSHRAKCNYRPLSMGIGLHTGILMVGVVGTEDRMQNTVISDAVNLASRLESITQVFGVSLAISEETFKKLSDPGSYKFRFIGKVRVKGKSAPVSVFEIFDGINPAMQERKIKANMFFEQGMVHYYQKNYAEALMSFRRVREILPDDGAAAFYMDNCLSRIKSL